MTLYIETIRFLQSERDDWTRNWKQGSCKLLARSQCSRFLKRIIALKASVRPHRFFGEAYVAAKLRHEEGWYCSYKWLTSGIWTGGKDPAGEFQQEFKQALRKHFPQLRELQARAVAFAIDLGEKPVAADLWLIRNDEHWFIETKIPPDDVNVPQLAGLALIATCLPSSKKVNVGIVYLQNEFAGDLIPTDIQRRFREYCKRLQRSNKALKATKINQVL